MFQMILCKDFEVQVGPSQAGIGLAYPQKTAMFNKMIMM